MKRQQIDMPPTDMMRRRTLLPFWGRFAWSDNVVGIRTDSPAILWAAEEIGLRLQEGPERKPAMQWEIVSEQIGELTGKDLKCDVTIDHHAVYLDMGPGEWFAFDLETGEGAGFIVLSNPDEHRDPHAVLYLRAIASNIRAYRSRKLEGLSR